MSNTKLGIDLGTHSYGWAKRNLELDGNQIESAGVIRFDSGVGTDKSGGVFTYSSVRTKDKGIRNRYKSEKDRKFEVLKFLIKYDMCPLSENELKIWKSYIKPSKRKDTGESRKFPKENILFSKWLACDFNYNLDGFTPEFDNIYELRALLSSIKLTDKENFKHKLGRSIYHVAHHRGFKSSKKVKEPEDKNNEDDIQNLHEEFLKGAEKSKVKFIDTLFEKHQVKTVGELFAKEIKLGNRVRSELQQYAIRKRQQDEVELILKTQGYFSDTEEFKNIIQAVFFQKKLKTQKGNIGKCTLEKNKTRCYISHYNFEEFSIREFINNIKINGNELSNGQKELIVQNFFLKTVKSSVKFSDVKDFLITKLNFNPNSKFNYKDKQTIGGCPISSYFQKIFGEDWKNLKIVTSIEKLSSKREDKRITYTIEDVWHILLEEEEEEKLKNIFLNKLELSEKQTIQLINCSKKFEQGFASYSLNAINKILPFLRLGLDNVKAKLLANVPKIIGEDVFEKNKMEIIDYLNNIVTQVNYQKEISLIVNNLIADWKNADYEEKLGFEDTSYKIDDYELNIIKIKLTNWFGINTWGSFEKNKTQKYIEDVANLYQEFFKDEKRSFIKLPTLKDALKNYLSNQFLSVFDEVEKTKKLNLIYHPSEIIFYSKSNLEKEGILQLGSPKHPALKNPKVMRSLHIMRNHLNDLLLNGEIDTDTEIIVELARELNDINKAYAIEQYQKRQEAEREQIIVLLKETFGSKTNVNPDSANDQDKLRFALEQVEMDKKDLLLYSPDFKRKENEWNYFNEHNAKILDKYIEKIKLWKEQNFRCIYSSKLISFNALFEEGKIDIEHTVPYSLCFDNSLKNKTVCDANFNRNIKGKKIPFELTENYDEILNNIQPWIDKAKFIEERIAFWKAESKKATGDKERKDKAIREKHLWQLEFDYWNGKVTRFTIKEITSKWVNAQITDTQIITKYAFHFLKTVFHKVRVEKGSITSDFRKILKIQPKEELEKNRTHHSHHAKDAAVLTLVPVSPLKEVVLKEAGEYWKKNQKQFHDFTPYKNYNPNDILSISDRILIDFKTKNNLFSRFEKIERKKGKKVPKTFFNNETGKKIIIYKNDNDGNIIYRKYKDGNYILKKDHNGIVIQDEHGGKIPLPEYKKIKGEGFRGSIYQDTFYGKVDYFKRDEKLNIVTDKEGNPEYEIDRTVLRKPIKDVLKETKNIVDSYVKLNIDNEITRIKLENEEKKEGKRDFVDTNIYQTNKFGKRVVDKNGNPIIIRHVRCVIPNIKAVPVKLQLFNSEKHTHFYAQEEDVAFGAIYETKSINGKKETIIKKDLVAKKPNQILDIKKNQIIENEYDFLEKRFDITTKKEIKPKYILKKKNKILFFKENKSELETLSIPELSKRLFLLSGIEENKAGKKLSFQNPFFSTEALKNLPSKVSELRLDEIIGDYKLSQSNWNFIVEGYDFEINTLGEIKWKLNND